MRIIRGNEWDGTSVLPRDSFSNLELKGEIHCSVQSMIRSIKEKIYIYIYRTPFVQKYIVNHLVVDFLSFSSSGYEVRK